MRASVLLLLSAFTLLFDILVSGADFSMDMMAADMMPSVITLWLVSSSMNEMSFVKWVLRLVGLLNLLLLALHVCRWSMAPDFAASGLAIVFMPLMGALIVAVVIYGMYYRMLNVKDLVKNSSVWTVVCISVDVVYFCFIIVGAALVQMGMAVAGVIVFGGIVAGVLVRMSADLKFVFWRGQETLIVESMKLTALPAARGAANLDDLYKSLYERIVVYFETRKPYLDSDLTINDLVKDIYSNKLYISKAISQFTGRNFCQFVNYYRVKHSMKCFRENPELKVHELATLNGFNSIVSYSMAFRLFMGEPPSDWCRKEKRRLLKKGK